MLQEVWAMCGEGPGGVLWASLCFEGARPPFQNLVGSQGSFQVSFAHPDQRLLGCRFLSVVPEEPKAYSLLWAPFRGIVLAVRIEINDVDENICFEQPTHKPFNFLASSFSWCII